MLSLSWTRPSVLISTSGFRAKAEGTVVGFSNGTLSKSSRLLLVFPKCPALLITFLVIITIIVVCMFVCMYVFHYGTLINKYHVVLQYVLVKVHLGINLYQS